MNAHLASMARMYPMRGTGGSGPCRRAVSNLPRGSFGLFRGIKKD